MMPSSIASTSSKHIKMGRLSLWGIRRWPCLRFQLGQDDAIEVDKEDGFDGMD